VPLSENGALRNLCGPNTRAPALASQPFVFSVQDDCTLKGYINKCMDTTSQAGEELDSRDGLGDDRIEVAEACPTGGWH
jgi:hypothetical protein